MRRIAAILLALALFPTIWLRSPPAPFNFEQSLYFSRISGPVAGPELGPFKLAGAWRLGSPNLTFGSYSALVPLAEGRLLAISDRGTVLEFSTPDAPAIRPPRLDGLLIRADDQGHQRDYEAAALDRGTGRLWLAVEGKNRIIRTDPAGSRRLQRQLPELSDWRGNIGPEAMARLADGRFVVLCECYTGLLERSNHPGFVYDRDPVEPQARARAFTLTGPAGYRPTDLASLPDGRLLVLMRRMTWPMPLRFKAKLVLVDPDRIGPEGLLVGTELAELAPPLPIDNFEGLAVVPGHNSGLTAWLISDDNKAVTQATLLVRLDFTLANLPPKQKAPGIPGRP
jgi:hypothetical protein